MPFSATGTHRKQLYHAVRNVPCKSLILGLVCLILSHSFMHLLYILRYEFGFFKKIVVDFVFQSSFDVLLDVGELENLSSSLSSK